MNITWLGHSCFVVESAGWRVVLDPYYVETYPALHIEADEALCSHGHRDHTFLEAVRSRGATNRKARLRSRRFQRSTMTRKVHFAARTPSISCAQRG